MNQSAPLSMRIQPGFEKDPLRPKRHHVVASTDGKNFFILGEPGKQYVTDPIELLRLEVEGQHAIGMPGAAVRIMDDDRQEVARYESYAVTPEDGPPDEARIKLRDRWLEAVMKFLLPPSLYAEKENPQKKERIARWFRGRKIEIEMREDGGAVRIWRDGAVLSSWGC